MPIFTSETIELFTTHDKEVFYTGDLNIDVYIPQFPAPPYKKYYVIYRDDGALDIDIAVNSDYEKVDQFFEVDGQIELSLALQSYLNQTYSYKGGLSVDIIPDGDINRVYSKTPDGQPGINMELTGYYDVYEYTPAYVGVLRPYFNVSSDITTEKIVYGDIEIKMSASADYKKEVTYNGALDCTVENYYDAIITKVIDGAIGLSLLPNSDYEKIEKSIEYDGSLSVSAEPSSTVEVEKLYDGKLEIGISPSSDVYTVKTIAVTGLEFSLVNNSITGVGIGEIGDIDFSVILSSDVEKVEKSVEYTGDLSVSLVVDSDSEKSEQTIEYTGNLGIGIGLQTDYHTVNTHTGGLDISLLPISVYEKTEYTVEYTGQLALDLTVYSFSEKIDRTELEIVMNPHHELRTSSMDIDYVDLGVEKKWIELEV